MSVASVESNPQPEPGQQAQPHASSEQVAAAWHDPKLANVLYHDWEAGTYDEKWSISYDERCITYALDRFTAIAGEVEQPYPTALELGSGTGFFLLNLMQGGVMSHGTASDISPGNGAGGVAQRRRPRPAGGRSRD